MQEFFFMKKPGKTAYDGAILTFGDHPFEDTPNSGSLQQILEQVGAHSPRVGVVKKPKSWNLN